MTTFPAQRQDQASSPSSADAVADSLLAVVRDERREFERRVRNEILEQHRRPGGWCAHGTNQVLGRLNLPLLNYKFTGQITLTVNVTVRNADDVSQAESWICNALELDSSDNDVVVEDFSLESYGHLHREEDE